MPDDIISLNLTPENPTKYVIFNPTSQMRKLRLKEGMEVPQDLEARKQQSQV
jgi:hypothetical protein